MTKNKIPNYHYAIFFRLVKELTEQDLIRRIRSIKNKDVPAGQRDFYIEFYEPSICPEGYTEKSSKYRMTLHEVTDQNQIDQRIREYNPTHCLAIKQKPQSEANLRKITGLACDLYYRIGPAGEKLLEDMVMHSRKEDWVKPV